MLHARHFYVAQWYIDITKIASKRVQSSETKPKVSNEERQQNKNSSKKKKKKKKRNHFSPDSNESDSSSSSSDEEDDDAKKNVNEDSVATDYNSYNQSMEIVDRRKKFLLSKINHFPEAAPGTRTQVLTTPLDAEISELISRFFASKKSFSQNWTKWQPNRAVCLLILVNLLKF